MNLVDTLKGGNHTMRLSEIERAEHYSAEPPSEKVNANLSDYPNYEDSGVDDNYNRLYTTDLSLKPDASDPYVFGEDNYSNSKPDYLHGRSNEIKDDIPEATIIKYNDVWFADPGEPDTVGLHPEYFQPGADLDTEIDMFTVGKKLLGDVWDVVKTQVLEARYEMGVNSFKRKSSIESPLPCDVQMGWAPTYSPYSNVKVNTRTMNGANNYQPLTSLCSPSQMKNFNNLLLRFYRKAGVPQQIVKGDLLSLEWLEENIETVDWDPHAKLTNYFTEAYDKIVCWKNFNHYTYRDILTVMEELNYIHRDFSLDLRDAIETNNQGLPTLSSSHDAKVVTNKRVAIGSGMGHLRMRYDYKYGYFKMYDRHHYRYMPWYGSFLWQKNFQDRDVFGPDHFDKYYDEAVHCFKDAVMATTKCLTFGENLCLNGCNYDSLTEDFGGNFLSLDFKHFDMSCLSLLPILYIAVCAYTPVKDYWKIKQILTYTFTCPIYVTAVTRESVLMKDPESWYFKAAKELFKKRSDTNVMNDRKYEYRPVYYQGLRSTRRMRMTRTPVDRYYDEKLKDWVWRISYYCPLGLRTLISGATLTSAIGNFINEFSQVQYQNMKTQECLEHPLEFKEALGLTNLLNKPRKFAVSIGELIDKYVVKPSRLIINNVRRLLFDGWYGGDDIVIKCMLPINVDDLKDYYANIGFSFHEDIRNWNVWSDIGIFLQNWYNAKGQRWPSLFRIFYSTLHLRRQFDLSTLKDNASSRELFCSMMFGKLSNLGFCRLLPRSWYDVMRGGLRLLRKFLSKAGVPLDVFTSTVDVSRLDWWSREKLRYSTSHLADYGKAALLILSGASDNFNPNLLNSVYVKIDKSNLLDSGRFSKFDRQGTEIPSDNASL